MLVNHATIRTLACVVSQDSSRLALGGLHFRTKKGQPLVEATDSHILLQAPAGPQDLEQWPNRNGSGPQQHTDDLPDCILETKPLVEAAKVAKSGRLPFQKQVRLTVPDQLPVEHVWSAQAACSKEKRQWQDFHVPAIDCGPYPNIDPVVPDYKEQQIAQRLVLSLPVLRKLFKALEALEGGRKEEHKCFVQLTIPKNNSQPNKEATCCLKAVGLHLLNSAGQNVTGVVMPLRFEQKDFNEALQKEAEQNAQTQEASDNGTV